MTIPGENRILRYLSMATNAHRHGTYRIYIRPPICRDERQTYLA
jgi:hypothetical protein